MKNTNGWLFNRERVFLAAMQDLTYLEFTYETSIEGLFPSEAANRLAEFGPNEIRLPGWQKLHGLDSVKHRLIESNLRGMYGHKIAVLRKGVAPFFEISATNLVPGDVVFLISGDVVIGTLSSRYRLRRNTHHQRASERDCNQHGQCDLSWKISA